jgi:hypothetical protein
MGGKHAARFQGLEALPQQVRIRAIRLCDPSRNLLIIPSMSSGESARTWLEKGAEAYAYMRLDEAGKDFQKAVEADPHSAKAHLCLGVIHLFQYQNGVALQHDPLRVPDESGCLRPLTPAEVEAEVEKKRAQIVEQNATNAPRRRGAPHEGARTETSV